MNVIEIPREVSSGAEILVHRPRSALRGVIVGRRPRAHVGAVLHTYSRAPPPSDAARSHRSGRRRCGRERRVFQASAAASAGADGSYPPAAFTTHIMEGAAAFRRCPFSQKPSPSPRPFLPLSRTSAPARRASAPRLRRRHISIPVQGIAALLGGPVVREALAVAAAVVPRASGPRRRHGARPHREHVGGASQQQFRQPRPCEAVYVTSFFRYSRTSNDDRSQLREGKAASYGKERVRRLRCWMRDFVLHSCLPESRY